MTQDIQDAGSSARGVPEGCRMIVAGSQIGEWLAGPDGFGNQVEIVQHFSDVDEWAASPEDSEADLLVLECPTVFPETVEMIRSRTASAKAARAIVVYHFSQDSTLETMQKHASAITAMRAPVTPTELKLACEADVALATIRNLSIQDPITTDDMKSDDPADGSGEIPPRQYSDAQLTKLSRISVAIQCECPHHMSSLLIALNAFEKYSRECENMNRADAALHTFLHRRTAHARSLMEDALSVLTEAEGIEV